MVTANGVDVLTEMYAIYMPRIKHIGPTAEAGGSVTHGRKKARVRCIALLYNYLIPI